MPVPEIVIPPDFALISVHTNSRSLHNCVNVFGAHMVIVDQDNVDEVCSNIAEKYLLCLSTASSFTGLRVIGNSGGDLFAVDSIAGHGVGSRGADMCPPNVQILAKKSTASVGRHHHGRTFFPEPLEAQVDNNGLVTAGEQLVHQNLCDEIFDQLDSSAAFDDFVLLHSEIPGSGTAPAPTSITAFTVEAHVATQRRRFNR